MPPCISLVLPDLRELTSLPLFSAEYVGLSLSYGLSLNSLLYVVVLFACQLENKMVSVERINQYSVLPSEAPLTIEGTKPPSSWPSDGKIELKGLKVAASHIRLGQSDVFG